MDGGKAFLSIYSGFFMAMILIKRHFEECYISGEALRLQRQNAGLTQRQLAELIEAATGVEYVMMNGQIVSLNKMTICRIEHSFETAIEYSTALIIQKILSNKD